MPLIKLIVGLGNPGKEYQATRHNAGFWLVERIAQRFNILLKYDAKYDAIVGRGTIAGQDVRLLLPQTYMNKSATSVVPFAKFFQIQPNEILVAHDELDIAPGMVRLKTGGGHGGHNGLRDIVPHLGSDFHRLRVGIGHPGDKSKVSGFVLGKAPAAEQALIDQALDEVLLHVDDIVQGDIAKAMNTIHSKK